LSYKGQAINDFFELSSFKLTLNSNCTVNLDSGYTVFIDRNKDDRNVTLVDTGNETFMLIHGDGEAVVMIKKLVEFHLSNKK